jgi:hypothetical protein
MSNDEQVKSQSMSRNQILALHRLRLPTATLKSLRATGIHCRPSVSVEHQHLAGKYVLRGAESGGAVADLGAYCSFAPHVRMLVAAPQLIFALKATYQ